MRYTMLVTLIGLLLGWKAGAADMAAGTGTAERWVSSWATAQVESPMPVPQWAFPPRGSQDPPSPPPSSSPIPPIPEALNNQTVRMIVRSSIGGRPVRIQLLNSNVRDPILVGSAHIGLHGKGSGIVAGSDRTLTFGGQASFSIVPGAMIVSDPVNLTVPTLTELAISLYLPGETPTSTVHPLGLHTTYIAAGNVASADVLENTVQNKSYFWLTGVEVLAPATSAAIAAFGDSITDGFSATSDTWRAWPSLLAEKFQANPATAQWSVLNLGISGNRLRRDGAGRSALARFDRDVLARPGVRWLVLLEGINDINISAIPAAPQIERTSTEQLIEAYREFIARAHLHGLKVVGVTIMPCEGIWLYTEKVETLRQAVNQWIRTGGAFDRVVDMDAVTRDPARPTRLKAELDSGDHIHPNDAGNRAMASAFDLRMFDH